MHNLCVFCTFSTFAQKILEGWGWNFTWSIGKVMPSKSMKMVFVASIIYHRLCMIYAFFYFFFQKSGLLLLLYPYGALTTCKTRQVYNGPQTSNLSHQQQKDFWSKMIFDQKIFSFCWDKLDYPGSIVCLSCFFVFTIFRSKSFYQFNRFCTVEIVDYSCRFEGKILMSPPQIMSHFS